VIWSPLQPDRVYGLLSQNLQQTRWYDSGFSGSVSDSKNSDGSRRVELCNRSGQRNSWQYQFRGLIGEAENGTWLTGDVGPDQSVLVFSVVWLCGVSAFFVGGLSILFSDLRSGHGLSALPFILIPGCMLVFFIFLTNFASLRAQSSWSAMDIWLKRLLDGRDGPSTQ
jgi:hypothetical protein